MSKTHRCQKISQFDISPNKTYKPTSEKPKTGKVRVLFPTYDCTDVFIYSFYNSIVLVPCPTGSHQMCIVPHKMKKWDTKS